MISFNEEDLHEFRKQIDANIQTAGDLKRISPSSEASRALAIAYTKLQEAKMWIGKCLEAIDAPFPEKLRDSFNGTDGGKTSGDTTAGAIG